MSERIPRAGSVPPWTLAIGAMFSVQLGSALSVHLIATVGPGGIAWLRLTAGAVIFLVIARPPLGSFTGAMRRCSLAWGSRRASRPWPSWQRSSTSRWDSGRHRVPRPDDRRRGAQPRPQSSVLGGCCGRRGRSRHPTLARRHQRCRRRVRRPGCSRLGRIHPPHPASRCPIFRHQRPRPHNSRSCMHGSDHRHPTGRRPPDSRCRGSRRRIGHPAARRALFVRAACPPADDPTAFGTLMALERPSAWCLACSCSTRSCRPHSWPASCWSSLPGQQRSAAAAPPPVVEDTGAQPSTGPVPF